MQRLTRPLLWLQWFGFLKSGQAKETETLQESLLYKEVGDQEPSQFYK